MPFDHYVVVLTTLPADVDAEKMATELVDARLAACVNILPVMRSVYRWKDRVDHEDERQLIIKTTQERLRELEARVRKLHPAEVPEFVVIPISSGSADYLSWLSDSTK
ncbi:MAG: divalent-cation tolerance protein CutA [Cyanobacteria bacterium]|nr:divalent-cation tolerance protein CutA [Cyanobacteriota bacterium]